MNVDILSNPMKEISQYWQITGGQKPSCFTFQIYPLSVFPSHRIG